MKNLLKNSFVCILTALLTVMLVYGGYSIYAQTTKFDQIDSGLFQQTNSYHGEMTAYFDEKIEKLNEILEKEDFYKDKNFNPPEDLPLEENEVAKAIAACGEDNVSSYCVSMGALAKYLEYVQSLDNLKQQLATIEDVNISPEALLTKTAKRNAKIEVEIAEAKKVLEATVATYNEYRLAYPMHKKYEELLEQLIKYKLSLKSIKNQVSSFPGKFIDSTSSQCK